MTLSLVEGRFNYSFSLVGGDLSGIPNCLPLVSV
jgi:hypothetical protein